MLKNVIYTALILLTTKAHAQFMMPLSFGYEQFAEQQSDGTQPKSLGLQIIPKYTINEISASAKLSYNYDLDHPSTGNDWDDGILSLSTTKLKPFSAVKTVPALTLELPFSKESRENRGINYVVDAGTTFI